MTAKPGLSNGFRYLIFCFSILQDYADNPVIIGRKKDRGWNQIDAEMMTLRF